MSWHFLREEEEASWAGSSLDGAPSALWSLMPLLALSCSLDNEMESLPPSRSGTTCELLMELCGGGGVMSCLVGSPAKTSHQRGSNRGLPGRDLGSGATWLASLERCDHGTLGWRTRQTSFAWGLMWFSGTLPRWGTMRSGELYQRRTPALHTKEKGSGSWPTPCKWDSTARSLPMFCPMARLRRSRKASAKWAGRKRMDALILPTAMAATAQGVGKVMKFKDLYNPILKATTKEDGNPNPDWISWLMGWPIGWANSQSLETGRFQQWLSSHGTPFIIEQWSQSS